MLTVIILLNAQKSFAKIITFDGRFEYRPPTQNNEKARRYVIYGLSIPGSPSWTRTSDIMINSHALYRLSY